MRQSRSGARRAPRRLRVPHASERREPEPAGRLVAARSNPIWRCRSSPLSAMPRPWPARRLGTKSEATPLWSLVARRRRRRGTVDAVHGEAVVAGDVVDQRADRGGAGAPQMQAGEGAGERFGHWRWLTLLGDALVKLPTTHAASAESRAWRSSRNWPQTRRARPRQASARPVRTCASREGMQTAMTRTCPAGVSLTPITARRGRRAPAGARRRARYAWTRPAPRLGVAGGRSPSRRRHR